MLKYLYIILLIFITIDGFSQFKYEKEVRIKENAVPAKARSFVDSMNFNSKIKWYKEIGKINISYEAKTKYNGKRYSIEFSEDGTFEDVEIEIAPKDIPVVTFRKIEEFIKSEYDRYSIEKVQIQYSGNPESVRAKLQERVVTDAIGIHFEIVISTKLDGAFRMFEYLFSGAGDFVRKDMIIEKSIDNIIY